MSDEQELSDQEKERLGAWQSRDDQGPSRAIDALSDPKLQDFAEKIVDRVSAIVGNHQLRVIDALAQIESNQAAFAHPLGALVAKQDIITDHLKRQDVALDALYAAFQTEHNQVAETLADFRASRQRSIDNQARLRADLDGLRHEQADQNAAHAHQLTALVAAVESLRLQHADLADSINGRLTELITASELVAHAAGRDAERAHPGGG